MSEESSKSKAGYAVGWLFLTGVAGVYLIVGILDPDTAVHALTTLAALGRRIAPVLVLVFAFLFVVNVTLKRQWIVRHLGKAAGLGGWTMTVVSGILAAGPLYAWYPLLAELREKGMSRALVAVFLYSRALKLPLLPLMVHYFGLGYTVALSLCIVAASVASGLLIAVVPDADTTIGRDGNGHRDHRTE